MRKNAIRLVLLSGIAICTQARAQEVPADEASADATGNAEIVVTAQRRSENLQTVPVSVVALSGEALKSRNLNDINQLSVAAPSFQVGSEGNYSVRGVGTLTFSAAVDSSVAIAIDDVNLGRPLLSAIPFNDLERVEVLNGPQGLLFGRNASAGLLNIATKRPQLGETGGSFSVEAVIRGKPGYDDNVNGVIARGTINLPIGNTTALRVNALYNYQQPVTTFVGGGQNRNDLELRQYAVKVKLLTEPTDRLSLYIIGDYAESHGIAGLLDRSYRSVGRPTSNDARALTADGVIAAPSNFTFGGQGGFWRDLETGGVQGTISYELDSGIELVNIASWKFYDFSQQIDTDYTNGNGADRNRNVTDFDQFSNELRLALPSSDRLTGQAGLYFYKAKIDVTSGVAGNNLFPGALLPNPPFCVGGSVPPCTRINTSFLGNDRVYTLSNESYAAFGQFTYAATDKLKLIAGGRVTHDKVAIDLVQNQGRYFVTLGIPASFNQHFKHTNFSWKLGGQYQFTPTIMAYATVGRGYKGPGLNDNGPAVNASLLVRPETSDNIEAGLRTSFFDRNLVLNFSAFRTKFEDYQIQSFDVGTASFIIQNAASVTNKGIELTALVTPFRGLKLNSSATILNSKFNEFAGAQCYPGQTTAGCSATNAFNAAGLGTPVSPSFVASGQATYEFAVGEKLGAFIEGNWYHRSSINFLPNQAPGARVGTIDILGASVGLRFDDRAKLSLFCRNCTGVKNPTFINLEQGDAVTGVATYIQQFNLDSVANWGLNFSFDF